MKPPRFLFLLLSASLLAANTFAVLGWGQAGVDRARIEALFEANDGNATLGPQWKALQGQPVVWQGTIHSVRHLHHGNRVEYRLKVLPQSLLYDTIAVLENTPAPQQPTPLTRGQTVRIAGTILHGTDVSGIHQVTVQLSDPPQAMGHTPHSPTNAPVINPATAQNKTR